MAGEVEVRNKAVDALATLQSGVGIMSTLVGNDFETKKEILNALTNAEDLSEHLGETIALVNVIGQAVVVNDAATDEPVDAVRSVLIAADGKAYAAVSNGIVASLRDIFAIMGQPAEWKEPLKVKVVEMKGSKAGRKFFKIVLAPAGE